jgi:hypothetical protein
MIADDLMALLDTAEGALEGLGQSPDRRGRFREAQGAVEKAVALAGADPHLHRFQSLLQKAQHCLRMGKPRECVAMLKGIRIELRGGSRRSVSGAVREEA